MLDAGIPTKGADVIKWKYETSVVEHSSAMTGDQFRTRVETVLENWGSNGWEAWHVEPLKSGGFAFYFKRSYTG